MECQIAVTQGIKGNLWHPVTHIREYLNININLIIYIVMDWIRLLIIGY